MFVAVAVVETGGVCVCACVCRCPIAAFVVFFLIIVAGCCYFWSRRTDFVVLVGLAYHDLSSGSCDRAVLVVLVVAHCEACICPLHWELPGMAYLANFPFFLTGMTPLDLRSSLVKFHGASSSIVANDPERRLFLEGTAGSRHRVN